MLFKHLSHHHTRQGAVGSNSLTLTRGKETRTWPVRSRSWEPISRFETVVFGHLLTLTWVYGADGERGIVRPAPDQEQVSGNFMVRWAPTDLEVMSEEQAGEVCRRVASRIVKSKACEAQMSATSLDMVMPGLCRMSSGWQEPRCAVYVAVYSGRILHVHRAERR